MLITSSVPHPRPNSDGYKDDGDNDPDNKIGCWNCSSVLRDSQESNNTYDDHGNGQSQGNPYG
jgi:hypothetical protein